MFQIKCDTPASQRTVNDIIEAINLELEAAGLTARFQYNGKVKELGACNIDYKTLPEEHSEAYCRRNAFFPRIMIFPAVYNPPAILVRIEYPPNDEGEKRTHDIAGSMAMIEQSKIGWPIPLVPDLKVEKITVMPLYYGKDL